MIAVDRAMKARRNSVCPLCRALVTVSQRIGRIRGTHRWAHVRCVIDAHAAELADLAALMTKPPTPGRVGQDHDTTTERTAP